MHELSDAAIALPGGYGTLDELFELLTWLQLGLHNKPIGLLNFNGFFNALIEMLNQMKTAEFLTPDHFNLLSVKPETSLLIDALNIRKSPSSASNAGNGI